MYFTLTTQNIIIDDNATEGLDTRFVETGYVFNKTLSTQSLPVKITQSYHFVLFLMVMKLKLNNF